MLIAASRRGGHVDFGGGKFQEAITLLLDDFRQYGKLTYVGWGRVHDIITTHLTNRLTIEHSLKQEPGILEEEIQRPIFVLGMPRSGTTLMQRLLATDPTNRSMRFWEGLRPAPPATPETWHTDPRIARSQRLIRAMRYALPDYNALHPLAAQAPDECRMLFMNTFMSTGFSLLAPLPTYNEWLKTQDMTDAYAHYRRQLQLLQFGYRRERWVLKSPPHARNLEVLLKIFPDASIICMHRDPLKVVPSATSLSTRMRLLFSDSIDPHIMGRELLAYCENLTSRLMSARDTLSSAPFHDVHYTDLVRDPQGTVEGIYERFGLHVGATFRDAMDTWLTDNPQHKHGIHRYSLSEYGLEREQVLRAFADYRARFTVRSEK